MFKRTGEKKKGGILKTVLIVIVVLGVISAAMGGNDDEKEQNQANATVEEGESQESKEAEKETETEVPIKYKPATANKLSDALSKNALKAQNDYKGKYIKITGKLGTIDSSGDYIGIDSDKDFDFTNIQCYIKNEDQKKEVAKMKKGDKIVVKGKCKDVGEFLGYSIDIDDIKRK